MLRCSALAACAVLVAALTLPAAPASAGAERAAIDALNDVRRAHGLHALRPCAGLGRSSGRWAAKMLRQDFFGHGARIEVAGGFGSAGETLAWHSGWGAQPRRTVSAWMNSPPHRAVLLSPRFHQVGMGLARGRLGSRVATTWVAHVGAR